LTFVAVSLLGASLLAQSPDRAPASAEATARQAAEAQARRAADRLAALHKESEALAKQERTLLAELRKLEIDREIKVEEIAKIQRDTRDVQAKLAAATRRSEELAGAAEQQRPDVEARMVQLYKMGRAGYWRMLLDVTSLRELGRAYRTAAALGRIDRERVEEHRKTLAALAAERANLQGRVKELAALARKAQDARAAAERAVQARTELVASIDARRDLNAQLTGELQDAQQKLQSTLTSTAPPAAAAAAAASTLPLPAPPSVPGLAAVAVRRHRVGAVRTAAGAQPRSAGEERHRAVAAGRAAGRGRPRRNGRLCRPLHRLRLPGHRRARRQGVLLIWTSLGAVRKKGRSGGRWDDCWGGGTEPGWEPGSLLRAPRRR
jgi:hypothetical protein